MGRGQAEHQVPCKGGEPEEESGDISSKGFAQGAEEDDACHDKQDAATLEEQTHIDEHAYTNRGNKG